MLKARRSTLAHFIARNAASGNHPHSGHFVETLVDGVKRAACDARTLHGSYVDFAELQAEMAAEIDVLVLAAARPPICITHTPGRMLVAGSPEDRMPAFERRIAEVPALG